MQKSMSFDFENIRSFLGCLEFQVDFTFTNDNIHSITSDIMNLPSKDVATFNTHIKVGDSFKLIDFKQFMYFLKNVSRRVDLDIYEVDLPNMRGFPLVVKEHHLKNSIKVNNPELLMKLNEKSRAYQKHWPKFIAEAIKNRDTRLIHLFLESIPEECVPELFKSKSEAVFNIETIYD
jgi:hypothetical protein